MFGHKALLPIDLYFTTSTTREDETNYLQYNDNMIGDLRKVNKSAVEAAKRNTRKT